MVAGNVPLMALGGTSAVPSMVEGADLVMVLASINRMTLQIYGVPAVESPQALKGKRLAITRPGTLTYFGGRLALRELGLKPDEDVAIVSLNDSAGVLAGVLGGAADAGVMTDPFTLLARKQGLRLLVDLANSPTEYLVAGVTTTHAYVQHDRPTLLSFLKGWVEGTKRYWDDREFAIAALGKYTEIDDREVLAESYDVYANYFARVPTPGAQSMQNILTDYADANPKAREVDPARTVDPSLIEELQREGFFRALGLE
jgi:ABC-type nitrate/sulfonate/bicarbonate transport system substrate-binding protein